MYGVSSLHVCECPGKEGLLDRLAPSDYTTEMDRRSIYWNISSRSLGGQVLTPAGRTSDANQFDGRPDRKVHYRPTSRLWRIFDPGASDPRRPGAQVDVYADIDPLTLVRSHDHCGTLMKLRSWSRSPVSKPRYRCARSSTNRKRSGSGAS